VEEHSDARMITTNASTLRAFNAIFCTGRYASVEVVLNLSRTKCLPVLLYGVEACPLLVRDRKSFDFTITRYFMKLFRIGSVTVVTDWQKDSHFYQSLTKQTFVQSNSLRNSSPVTTTSVIYFRRKQKLA